MIKSKTLILIGITALLTVSLALPVQAGNRHGHGHDKSPRYSNSEGHRGHYNRLHQHEKHRHHRKHDHHYYRDHHYYPGRHYYRDNYYYYGQGFPEGLILGGALGYIIGQEYN